MLILSASPRKLGNSDILCDIFMKGAIESGNSVKKTIWGEGVWQKGEVVSTKAMDEAYETGKSL